jgi:diguanylate cyclase (GGDEF)-like protein
MLMVAGLADEDVLVQVNADFGDISALKEAYIATGNMSDLEARRFQQAVYAIQAYRREISAVGEKLMTASFDEAHKIYQQELAPLSFTASEMLDSTIEIGDLKKAADVKSGSLIHGVAQLVLILGTIAGVCILYVVGRSQIDDAVKMQLKQEELEETSDRLIASRQKLLDSAHTNILTGLRNRYALEQFLSPLLSARQFYIGVFDIDNFRQINDQFGYEYGDEYLIAISDRLKTKYANIAEIFHVHGNEFCMIFKEDASDMQTKMIAEQIRQSIGSNTQVSGMLLSSNVSAALYHVLPSESKDVGALLRKLDTALHTAKADGGNRMYYV